MRKLFVLVFVSAAFLHGTLQDADKSSTKEQKNNSVDVSFLFRTFKGVAVKRDPNLTQASNSTYVALQLQGSSASEYLNGPISTRVIPILYLMAVIVGIPANVTILCFLATKIRKVSSAILYCSLAVNDLLLLVSLLFKAHYHLRGNHWVFGEAACRVVTACFYGNLYCSALTVACICVKRFMAVVHPFMYRSLPRMMCTVWVVLAVWGVFGAAVVPELWVQQSFQLLGLNRTTCHDVLPLDHSSHSFLLYYNLVLTVVCLLVPLVVMVVCFVQIIRELGRSHSDWAMYIKASSLVFSLFMVCFLPAGVLHFLHYVQLFVNGTEALYAYFNMAVCLCCLHACVDPFLFILMSRASGSRVYFMNFKGKNLSISI